MTIIANTKIRNYHYCIIRISGQNVRSIKRYCFGLPKLQLNKDLRNLECDKSTFHLFGPIIIFGIFENSSSENVKLTTPLGNILGSTLKTRSGKTIYAFRGVRYAQPPIGDLRFKPPVPVPKWENNFYNATEDGPVCPQPNLGEMSEDCLFLNVYTTKLPQAGKPNPKRPVIIHLHSGGFYSVTGQSIWAGPQYFLDRDIVLVTLNYRLATLGFMSVGKEVPGNNGLKDQVVAMKWVRDNIAAFGGDPGSVTLFGYSAGSWSITLHMVSPMSRGLFHRAILGSGTALGHWPLPSKQINLAKKQAQFLGCPESTLKSTKDIVDCLRTKKAEDFGNSFFQFKEFGDEPILVWSPVIEENYGQERFLPEDPVTMISRGDFMNVPIIAGLTAAEFDYKAFLFVNNSTMLNRLNDNWEKYAPICFIYERDTEKSKLVSREARKFYLGEEKLSNSSYEGLKNLFTDSIEGFPVHRTVELLSEKSSEPVYYYRFTYKGKYSHFYIPGSNGTETFGPIHHDDLIYLFYISKLFPYFNQDDPEGLMTDKLSTLYANFATTGKPTPKTDGKLDNVDWECYESKSRKYLEIDRKLQMKSHLFEDRYKFWGNLYPLPQ